jgi:glutaredoxin-like YruB-family protein
MSNNTKVVIYSTPYCVFCKKAKDFFQKNGVQYEEKDVASDLAAREDMLKKSGQMGVPVIEAGGKIIIGFDQARLREALGIAS